MIVIVAWWYTNMLHSQRPISALFEPRGPMHCIFYEVPRATFMIHPEGFKTILDFFSHHSKPNIWNTLYDGVLICCRNWKNSVLPPQNPTLPPSSSLSVRYVTCRVTALSIKRSMCLLPLNQVDWLLKSYWRSLLPLATPNGKLT